MMNLVQTAEPGAAPFWAGSIRGRALDAQAELLPYALGFFGIALPMFVFAGAYAADAAWMSLVFAQFSINWGAFYAVVNRFGRKETGPLSPPARTALHLAGGLAWALVVAEIAVFGFHAGRVRPVILEMDAAAAVACFFFTSPWLEGLLIMGPAAGAPPLLAFFISGDKVGGTAASAGLALALALCLVVNRILRKQFALDAEREALMAERSVSLDTAERLARSKSHILATLSHEIRNGLTGVTHVLAAAAGGGRAAPSREQLSAALAAAHDLLEVLNATLDTETAGAGKLTLAAEPFDPARLARSVVLLTRPKAAAKGLELNIHIDELLSASSGAAIGDEARVRQILSNLIGNAVKYTTRGRVEVRVQRTSHDRLSFEVVDTGPGLTPDELERAFEPFRRIERVGLGLPGAGLGLSLSRELARLMGGEVAAESAMGVGSRFWLDLPFDPAAAPADAFEDPEDLLAPSSSPVATARSLKVLVAEDDALNAAMLRAVLEQLGHQVVHAHDGQRAVELAGLCPFDLIMLDGRMPQLNGPDAAKGIRALPGALGEAPIIAVIGGDADEATACLDAGVDQVLRKPVTVAAVARALAGALHAKNGGPRPTRTSDEPFEAWAAG